MDQVTNSLEVTVTKCECCDDLTYHITVPTDAVTISALGDQAVIHLTEEEMEALYFELKEFKTGMKEVPYA